MDILDRRWENHDGKLQTLDMLLEWRVEVEDWQLKIPEETLENCHL